MRIPIKNIAAAGIAYKASDPSQIFFEIKTPGYWPIFVGTGCFIGGNWVGNSARADTCPFDTFAREVRSELSFDRPEVSYEELKIFCPWIDKYTYVAPGGSYAGNPDEIIRLQALIEAIVHEAESLGDYLVRVPQSLIQSKHDSYIAGELVSLVSAYASGLPDDAWEELEHFQRVAGNLSCESQTAIMRLDQLIERGFVFCCGYSNILREYFQRQGVPNAHNTPLMAGIEVTRIGEALHSYVDYLARYTVEKQP